MSLGKELFSPIVSRWAGGWVGAGKRFAAGNSETVRCRKLILGRHICQRV